MSYHKSWKNFYKLQWRIYLCR